MKATDSSRVVLGVCGNAASGKDTVARMFEQEGFYHLSTSDLVREEISNRGLTTSRALQTEIANELRVKNGEAFFVIEGIARAVSLAGRDTPILLSGLYAPAEGVYLKRNLEGRLVFVTVPQGDEAGLRFQRLKQRSDAARDEIDFEEFMAAHRRENSGAGPSEANVEQLSKLADFTIINSGDLNYLQAQVQGIARELADV